MCLVCDVWCVCVCDGGAVRVVRVLCRQGSGGVQLSVVVWPVCGAWVVEVVGGWVVCGSCGDVGGGVCGCVWAV